MSLLCFLISLCNSNKLITLVVKCAEDLSQYSNSILTFNNLAGCWRYESTLDNDTPEGILQCKNALEVELDIRFSECTECQMYFENTCYDLIPCNTKESNKKCSVIFNKDLVVPPENSIIFINGDATQLYILKKTYGISFEEIPLTSYLKTLTNINFKFKLTSLQVNGIEKISTPVEYTVDNNTIDWVYVHSTGLISIQKQYANNYRALANFLNQQLSLYLDDKLCGYVTPSFDETYYIKITKGNILNIVLYHNLSGSYNDGIDIFIDGNNLSYSIQSLSSPPKNLRSSDLPVSGALICANTEDTINDYQEYRSCDVPQQKCNTCPEGYDYSNDYDICYSVNDHGQAEINKNCIVKSCVPDPPDTIVCCLEPMRAIGTIGAVAYDNYLNYTLPLIITYNHIVTDSSSNIVSIIGTSNENIWTNREAVIAVPRVQLTDVYIGHACLIYKTQTNQVFTLGIACKDKYYVTVNGVEIIRFENDLSVHTRYRLFELQNLYLGLNEVRVYCKTANHNSCSILAFEIFDTNINHLLSITTQSELDSHSIINSKAIDFIQQHEFTIGEASGDCQYGYVCNNPSYYLNTYVYPPHCIENLYENYTKCCFKLTNCQDDNEYYTTYQDLTTHIGTYVQLEGYEDKCFLVEKLDGDCRTVSGEYQIIKSFATCTECLPSCFKLVNCQDETDYIYVANDLLENLGKVIKIKGCPDKCYLILPGDNCSKILQSVFIDAIYPDCITCYDLQVPKVIPTHRAIKPGYYTPACPPKYVIETECNYADAIYKEVVQKRFGIKMCCIKDYYKYYIKKKLLDLKSLYSPELCSTIIENCEIPCNIVAEIIEQTEVCPYPIVNKIELKPKSIKR